jgi:hypothetical protein
MRGNRQLAHRKFFEPVEGNFRGLREDHRQSGNYYLIISSVWFNPALE